MKATDTKVITNIAMGVGALIVGGLAIFSLSRAIPFPGGKYLLMSPYLSMVMYVIMRKAPSSLTPFMVGAVFGGIMTFVNIFMGIAIVSTGIGASLMTMLTSHKKMKMIVGAVSFSSFTLATSLTLSKYIIGGAFERIPLWWILIATLLGTLFGGIGTYAGTKIMRYMK
jgi:energy-coupling factor transport system substrate-specific component